MAYIVGDKLHLTALEWNKLHDIDVWAANIKASGIVEEKAQRAMYISAMIVAFGERLVRGLAGRGPTEVVVDELGREPCGLVEVP